MINKIYYDETLANETTINLPIKEKRRSAPAGNTGTIPETSCTIPHTATFFSKRVPTSAEGIFTGTITGNRHYYTSIVEGPLLTNNVA